MRSSKHISHYNIAQCAACTTASFTDASSLHVLHHVKCPFGNQLISLLHSIVSFQTVQHLWNISHSYLKHISLSLVTHDISSSASSSAPPLLPAPLPSTRAWGLCLSKQSGSAELLLTYYCLGPAHLLVETAHLRHVITDKLCRTKAHVIRSCSQSTQVRHGI